MLMMCVAAISAQKWSLTPEIGMAAIKRGGGTPVYQQKWNASWKVGVGVEYAVKPGFFSLKSGLYYTPRGYSYSMLPYQNNYGYGQYGYETSHGKVNRHFLQLPLMANFSFKLADGVRLNLAAGPYIGYSLGEKGEYNSIFSIPGDGVASAFYHYYGGGYGGSYGGNYGSITFKGWSHDNPLDWGVSLQVGLEVQQWVINAGYDASLGKEFEGGPVDMKYNTLSLSVGYKFKLGQ